MQRDLAFMISKLYVGFKFTKDQLSLLDSLDKEFYEQIISKTGNPLDPRSLYSLTEILCTIYEKRVMLFIDEYDTPLVHAQQNGYYEDMVSFYSSLLLAALKENQNLYKACLMGITELTGAGMLSGFNNYEVFSPNNSQFCDYFGFTIEEVKGLMNLDERDFKKLQFWYNGYNFGDNFKPVKFMNPYSFSRWYNSTKNALIFNQYWVGSSITESLVNKLEAIDAIQILDFLTLASEGCMTSSNSLPAPHHVFVISGQILVGPLITAVKFSKKKFMSQDLTNFLILAGYLTYFEEFDEVSKCTKSYARIPNYELLMHWNSEMAEFLAGKTPVAVEISGLFFEPKLNFEAIRNILKRPVEGLSIRDIQGESTYHYTLYGIFSCWWEQEERSRLTENQDWGIQILSSIFQA